MGKKRVLTRPVEPLPEGLSTAEVFKAALIGCTIAAFQPGALLHQQSSKSKLLETYVDNVLQFATLLTNRASQQLLDPQLVAQRSALEAPVEDPEE